MVWVYFWVRPFLGSVKALRISITAIFAYRAAESQLLRLPHETPMSPLGYSKEQPFQAHQHGALIFFVLPLEKFTPPLGFLNLTTCDQNR